MKDVGPLVVRMSSTRCAIHQDAHGPSYGGVRGLKSLGFEGPRAVWSVWAAHLSERVLFVPRHGANIGAKHGRHVSIHCPLVVHIMNTRRPVPTGNMWNCSHSASPGAYHTDHAWDPGQGGFLAILTHSCGRPVLHAWRVSDTLGLSWST